MADPRTRRDRERAQQRAHNQAAQRQAAAARRQRRVLAIVGLVLVVALFAGFAGAMGAGSSKTTTTTTSSASTTTSIPLTGVDVPKIPPGEQLTTATTCPPEDRSAPRVTTFSGPPPDCIDDAYFYEADISTTKGDMKINLNPRQARGAVNNYFVLANYHYYDGLPFTVVLPRKSIGVSAEFDNPPGRQSPGYALPSEVPPQGQIFVPGSICMVPVSASSDDYGGAFLLATFDMAPDLPQNLTQFGVMLDGADALRAIDKVGSQSGQPTEVVTVNAVSVHKTTKIDQ